jgi:hypothetical protein
MKLKSENLAEINYASIMIKSRIKENLKKRKNAAENVDLITIRVI